MKMGVTFYCQKSKSMTPLMIIDIINEPLHGKTNNLHMQKQRHKPASQNLEADISIFVFATGIVQFLYFLNPELAASSQLLWPNSLGQTWSETQIVGFVMQRLKCILKHYLIICAVMVTDFTCTMCL